MFAPGPRRYFCDLYAKAILQFNFSGFVPFEPCQFCLWGVLIGIGYRISRIQFNCLGIFPNSHFLLILSILLQCRQSPVILKRLALISALLFCSTLVFHRTLRGRENREH